MDSYGVAGEKGQLGMIKAGRPHLILQQREPPYDGLGYKVTPGTNELPSLYAGGGGTRKQEAGWGSK